MDSFRNLNLQRALSMALLFAALFSQVHTLYACDSMDGEFRHVCCCSEHDSASCPMANNCAMHEYEVEKLCCEISYDVVTDSAMMNSTSTVDCLILLLDGPQPPPVIVFQQFSYESLQLQSRLSLSAIDPPTLNRGNLTYFLTRRLRL